MDCYYTGNIGWPFAGGRVSVPLRGVDCYLCVLQHIKVYLVSVPLRGVDCYFCHFSTQHYRPIQFPSPYGVWIATSSMCGKKITVNRFRPLTGCGLLRIHNSHNIITNRVSVPLRGVDCYPRHIRQYRKARGFRPLTGCGLLHSSAPTPCLPLQFPSPYGVWIATSLSASTRANGKSFRPLTGCGLLLDPSDLSVLDTVSVPLRGVDCYPVPYGTAVYAADGFPSPYGVWIATIDPSDLSVLDTVSVPLRGVDCYSNLHLG